MPDAHRTTTEDDGEHQLPYNCKYANREWLRGPIMQTQLFYNLLFDIVGLI